MKEITLNVKGMVCGGCENRVKNAVGAIEGVKNVDANFNTGIVKIEACEDVKLEEIEETINDIGFEVIK